MQISEEALNPDSSCIWQVPTCTPSSPLLRDLRMDAMTGAVVVGLPIMAACGGSMSGEVSVLEVSAGIFTRCGRWPSATDRALACCMPCSYT